VTKPLPLAHRTPVAVRGMGLSSALGVGLDACLSSLLAGGGTPAVWHCGELDLPFAVPLYLIPGADSLVHQARAVPLVQETVAEAIAMAGLSRDECRDLPVFLGTSSFSFDRDTGAELGRAPHSAIGVAPVLAHEQVTLLVHEVLGGQGESFGFQTACTSSANAATAAARMVELGWFPHALVVGVELANLATIAGFSSLQLTASAVRPFDAGREGIVLGEGVGAVVLSRAGPEETGLFLRGGGSSIDSYRVTTSNPDGERIAQLQEEVLRRTGVAPSEVRGIKAHGTGSPMNDAGEAAVIRRAFSTSPPPVFGLKGYLGHTLGACGVIELVLMASALQRGVIPATPGFTTPDAALGITPTTRPVAAPDGGYLLNFFGFGGHNTIQLLEKRS